MPESQAVAQYEPPAQPPAELSPAGNLLAQVIAAAKDPTIDAGKMEALVKLVNSQQDREREIEFNRDLNAAMMEMPVITKDGVITIPAKDGRPARTQGRFARFEDIDRVCRPILQRRNLAVRFEIGESGGTISVRPIISHSNGHTERGEAMKLPLDTSGAKNNTQGAGSAASYGKRYTYCAILNIITEGVDDDGNMGRAAQITMPHERGELVLQEAEAAHGVGNYLEFFGKLGPKDRAWLMQSGNHAKFGGQVALPTARTGQAGTPAERTPPPGPPPSPPPADGPPRAETKRAAITPRQWVDRLKTDLDKCHTVDFLDEFMEGKRDPLDRLKGTDPALWEETQEAYRARRDAINAGRMV